EELDIVAPPSAFVGRPPRRDLPFTPGSGSFFNYELQREQGQYAFTVGTPGGVIENRYISTYGRDNLEFHRASTRWYRFYPNQHFALQLGDARTDGGMLGEAAAFAGLHWATDFKTDPNFISYGHPSVSGVALAPSLLEVYVNN